MGPSYSYRLAQRVRIRAALLRGTPTGAAERTSAAFGPRLRELAASWQPDIVQLEFRIMGQFLPALSDCPAPRLLVDHDPASAVGTLPRGVFARLEHRAWKALAQSVSEHVDSIVVFTERDRKTVAALSGGTPVVCIPLGWEVREAALDPVGRNASEVVYVGSFIHPPNVDAVVRLAREIFPRVRMRVPDATLRLVGSYPPQSVLELRDAGVTVTGEVPDVRPYLDAAAVVAAPIRTGGGMRVKLLEAVAGGKAIVASSLAIEGLALIDGEQVVLAETDAEFVDALVRLLTDPARRAAIGSAARSWAEVNLDLESQSRAYGELYVQLLSRGKDGGERVATTAAA